MSKRYWNPSLENLSREALWEEVERPLLFHQIQHVLKASPFYREKYAALGFALSDVEAGLDLAQLPFTEKSEIVEDQKANPPFGKRLAVPIDQVRRVHRTSGYSGSPVYIAYTESDIAQTLEAGARSFWCAGVRPDDIIIHCLNYCLWTGGLTDHMCLEHTGACVIPYGVGNSRNLLKVIQEMRPTAISCTPSYLPKLEAILMDEMGMNPRELRLKKGLFGGEPGIQNPAMRERIEETWGIEAIDANYGVSDVLSIFGSECEARDGLHFHGQGILHVELIDPSTEEPLEFCKGTVGEFVYTTLLKEGQPLIRFRSRDVAEIVNVDRCDCGRWGFRFRILGRSDDMLIVKGINVFPYAIGDIVAGFPKTLSGEYQIVLDTPPPYDYLVVEVEHWPGVDATTLESVRDRLGEAIRDQLEFIARVSLVPEGVIRRDGEKARLIRRVFG